MATFAPRVLHAHLAVHAVGHATVARYAVAKVLDLEPALEAAGEETPEGRDQRRERRQHERVELRRPAHQVFITKKTGDLSLFFFFILKKIVIEKSEKVRS